MPYKSDDSWLRLALYGGVPRRALITALIVGPILILINQGDTLIDGRGFDLLKAILTVCVPYAVATWGAVGAKRAAAVQAAPSPCHAGDSRLSSAVSLLTRSGDFRVKARVHVTLKNGVLDPQGKAIQQALGALGFSGVGDVRQGKVLEFTLAESDHATAEARVREMCEKLLANTVIENYSIQLES